ncbi:tripartite-type tricarboxylate transporter receptor subunit TctC [Variovorax boronicumulans]|uniref:Tripartite-type tricarboxylate transporter receptor subunit TctC n=2 Tax=Variovorax boronicumulans TaxID=436515 RepID=A0AAW8D4T0_9BURK|nr:tripartite tricarboxylate transporter substrate binding protein [Variovorax boronicumulans]MDP9895017.1 tripartite-type tricarboxylate transporter receptor subunit TctC [Variovorax boronicumulans]MDQ0038510.1 tripartite-type tricarboxylate transporter receptor subunit TctC [Variovorax boronicumulans]MDQ0054664.1 tripartite-type tricarboxylate transporter receptor subunit TctC [Variovorax boronicumulans]
MRAKQELIRRVVQARLGFPISSCLAMSLLLLRTRAARLLCLFGALACAGVACAQSTGAGRAAPGPAGSASARAPDLNWPTRPLRLVVGFGGGSSPDFVARVLAPSMAKALGQPVIVENHPGASGNIAADIVAKSTDRHTVGILINGNMTIAKVLNPATSYDPQKDLVPLSIICTAPLVLATTPQVSKAAPRDFLEAAKRAGRSWSYGTPGIGTIGHLGMELLKARTGIEAVHVPYQGNPQVITGLIGAQLQLALLPPGLAQEQVKAGKLRAIGVTSARRSELVPDYPTLQDAGLKDFELEIWTAAAAPASLPAPIAQRLSQVLEDVIRLPEVRQKLFLHGYEAAGISGEALVRRVKADTAALTEIIASQGIKLE